MSFMQFEFDVVPALLGVSIYVFCQLLIKGLAPHTKKSREPPKAELLAKEAELFEETVDEDFQDACDEPEPVPEPAAEPEVNSEAEAPAAPAGKGRTWLTFSWRALAVLLVISRIALPLWFQRGTEVVEEMQAGVEQPSNLTNLPPALEMPSLEAKPAEEVVDVDMGDGQEAFSIKLTRQVMNDENYVRSAYYGEIMVGTPPTRMTVVFDTGSGHLVLPSMYCKSATCKAHRRYRRSASKTARDIKTHGATWTSGPRDSVTVSFGTGEITGVFVEDVICMSHVTNASDYDGWNTSRPECMLLHFIAATELSEDPFKKFHFDGILGLGLSGLSQAPNFNFMQVISESSLQGLGSRNPQTFGVFLSDHIYEDSEIALGGWAQRHLKEDLSWGPIHDPEMGHWIIPIRGIRIDEYHMDFCKDGTCRAAVDTGTSLVAVPTAAFREMYEQMRHPAPLSGHCRGFGPLLHFELDSLTVSLGPKDYGQVKKTHKSLLPQPHLYEGKPAKGRPDLRCLPMLMTLDLEEPIGPKLFVLGEPVLRKYYTVYDAQRKQVGIGRARHIKGPSREELLEMVPDVEPVASRRSPTMFDVFRWRKALQNPVRSISPVEGR